MAATSNPTWGYKPDGSAEIFDLAPGAALPDGWESSPACISNPVLATADALSAAAAGREYVPPVTDAVSGFVLETAAPAVDADDLANALAEIDRLRGIIETGTAENERLVKEAEEAEAGLEDAAKQIVALKAGIEQAQADGGFAADELKAARDQIEALTGDLAKARTDLDELLNAPPEATAPAAKSKTAR